jgi:cobalt-zinc-cadmium efflux system outer membrane protein
MSLSLLFAIALLQTPAARAAGPEPVVLTADTAAAMAVERSPMLGSVKADVAIAWARARAARAEQRLVWSASLFGSVGDGMFMVGSPGGTMPDDMYQSPGMPGGRAALRLDYPIYTGRRLEGMEEEAEHNASASESDRLEQELEVRLSAKLAYRQALLAQALAQIADQEVAALDEQVRVAKQQREVGRIAEVDLLRQEAALSDAKSMQREAHGEVEMALVDLRAMLTLDQATSLTLEEPLGVPAVDLTREELVAAASASRPTVKAADERILAAGGMLKSAEGTGRPEVHAFAGGTANAMGSARVMPGWAGGLSMSIPIGTGGRTSALKAEARAMIDKMTEMRRQLLIDIDRDLSALVVQYQVALDQLGLADDAIKSADEAYRVTRVKYEAGKTIVAELLDALRMRTEAYVKRATAGYRAQATADRIARSVADDSVVGAPVALPLGWENVSLWSGMGGEVVLSLNGASLGDLLGWLARDEGVAVSAPDVPGPDIALTGAYRALDVTSAALDALDQAGVAARSENGALIIPAW